MNLLFTPPKLKLEKDGHFYWLDLIRFLAAFAVLACHFRGAFFVDFGSLPPSQQNIFTSIFFGVTRLGHEAVLVFFVLSGFLVGGKSLIRIHNQTFQPFNYALDRAVRILLPLFSSLLLFAIVCWISGIPFSFPTAIGNLLSLQGILCPVSFETLWSLSYEVWFYIIMCGIGYCFVNKGNWKVFLGIFTVSVCMIVFTKLEAFYLFIWILGALAYFIAPCRNRWITIFSILASLIMVALLQITSASNIDIANNELSSVFRQGIEVFSGLIFSICLSQVIQFAPSSKAGIKLNIWGSKLAAFSYTLYLTHIPIRDLLIYLGAPKSETLSLMSITLFLCWLGVAMVVAYAIYFVFERNTNVVKKGIKSFLQKRTQ